MKHRTSASIFNFLLLVTYVAGQNKEQWPLDIHGEGSPSFYRCLYVFFICTDYVGTWPDNKFNCYEYYRDCLSKSPTQDSNFILDEEVVPIDVSQEQFPTSEISPSDGNNEAIDENSNPPNDGNNNNNQNNNSNEENPDGGNPDGGNPNANDPDGSNNSNPNSPDPSNPDSNNPDPSNPDSSNPDLSNPDSSNPDLSNPDSSNPDPSNPGSSISDDGNQSQGNQDGGNPDGEAVGDSIEDNDGTFPNDNEDILDGENLNGDDPVTGIVDGDNIELPDLNGDNTDGDNLNTGSGNNNSSGDNPGNQNNGNDSNDGSNDGNNNGNNDGDNNANSDGNDSNDGSNDGNNNGNNDGDNNANSDGNNSSNNGNNNGTTDNSSNNNNDNNNGNNNANNNGGNNNPDNNGGNNNANNNGGNNNIDNSNNNAGEDIPETDFVQDAGVRSCHQHLLNGALESGEYVINLRGQEVTVYCDMVTEGGGWTILQRRGDYGRGKNFFLRSWDDYKKGFGDPMEDFWLGLNNMHQLTKNDEVELLIELEDFENNRTSLLVNNFTIGSEANGFKISYKNYNSKIGNSLPARGTKFSTIDMDNDAWKENCAKRFSGAWWYSACHNSNLNGLYLEGKHESFGNGVNWYHWKGYHYSLKNTEMKVRPTRAAEVAPVSDSF